MGPLLSHIGIKMSTRINQPDTNRIPVHHKCRNCGGGCSTTKSSCINENFTRTGTNTEPLVKRPVVPDDKVRWSTPFDYRPIEFTSEKIQKSTKEYTDKDPRYDLSAVIPWNSDDQLCDRRSYHGSYKIIGGVPQNPCGRTGVTGRGFLGHFGPNHAADPIVTRWKLNADGQKVIHPATNKPILQFVCVRRKDTDEFAIPGGMVDKKEKITDTLQREFQEETLNFPDLDKSKKHDLLATIKDIFENGGVRIYCGYVDDPRNTDNCWMETTAYNFHDEHNEHLALIEVHGGSDATSAFWHDLSSQLPLFASHADFLRRVAEMHRAHW